MHKYDEIINFYFGKATNFRMDIVTKVEILYVSELIFFY